MSYRNDTQVVFLCVEKRLRASYPVFFLDYGDSTILEELIKQFSFVSEESFCFVVDNEKNAEIISRICPKAKIVYLPGATKGCACSTLYAVSQMDQNKKIWVVSTNEITRIDYDLAQSDLETKCSDVGVIGFSSLIPKYAYALMDGEDVVRVEQYKIISDTAITGVTYFSNTGSLVEAIETMILKGGYSDNGNYYVSMAINELILKNKKVKCISIDKKTYLPIKTEVDSLRY